MWDANVAALRPTGYLVNYGHMSGPLDPIDPMQLNSKSLFFAKVSLPHFMRTPEAKRAMAEDVFAAIADGIVYISSLSGFLHVLLIGRIAARHDWALLAAGQFLTCALLSMGVALFTEDVAPQRMLNAAAPILYGGVLSVGIAYTLQVVAQRKAPPAHAAVILSLETVFAALGGWLLLDEHLPPRGLTGCGLMLVGMLISQWQTGDRDP